MISSFSDNTIEAGCDEAGRGCLAGPVFAAAVILPRDFYHPLLNDSKQLTEKKRLLLKDFIEKNALSYGVRSVSEKEIDQINILNASIRAMHLALNDLTVVPDLLLIDGNKFSPYKNIQHHCIIKGDSKYACIAAASILAKTYRDAYMKKLSLTFPSYGWETNKGYATLAHRIALVNNGPTRYHRKSFTLKNQRSLFRNPLENMD